MTEYRLSSTRRIAPMRVYNTRIAAGLRETLDPQKEWSELLKEDTSFAVCSAWERGRKGRLLGLGLLMDMEASDGVTRTAELPEIFVEQESQHRGIGTAIGKQLLTVAYEEGFQRVETENNPEDIAKVNFCFKLGFLLETPHLAVAINPNHTSA